MAEVASAIIDGVKFAGRPVWIYLKNQYQFTAKLEELNHRKQDLVQLEGRIQSRLHIELQTGRKIARSDVGTWLTAARDEISRPSVEDEVSQSRCLSSLFRRTGVLQRRVSDLIKIYDQGEKFNQGESLVNDDCSGILEDNMKIFEELKNKLRGKSQDVRGTLRSQLGFRKIEKEQVKIWLQEVEEMIGPAAEDVEDQVRRGHPSQHASLANLVKEGIVKMKKLYSEGGQFPESFVIDDPSASALELPTSELQEGSDVVKAKILECLLRDEVTKLGVWGMGGIGKTTIMEHVHNELLKVSKFKVVIWITVSQTFDVRQIQQQIASSLNGILSEHQNRVVRAAKLSKMLQSYKPYVLILDDVWRSFELKEVGIPEPPGCKLVLTTRSERVVHTMNCVPIKVNTLSSEASLVLFLDNVGDVDMSGGACIRGTLEQIVDECGGLPLAIKTIAGSMKGISDPHIWSAALNQLRDGRRNVAGTEDDEFLVLKFSYDWLNNKKIQYCFLHCAMYPEDYRIPKDELIEYWIDEELIDVMETRQAMKDEGHAILKKLQENCLLEFTEDQNDVSCVRMHDLVRDMAIHITRSSNPRFLVKAGVRLRELPEEHEWKEDLSKVSLMFNQIEEIPSTLAFPKCLMLTTVLLSGYHNLFSTIPELFFDSLPELKVLDLSNNWNLKSLPGSLSKLVKLTTLLLRGCKSLKKVPSLSKLKVLKRLDIYETAIEEVPQGLEMLIDLKCLDISGLWIPQVATSKWEILSSQILPNLSKLQNLEVDCRIPVTGKALERLGKVEKYYGRFPTAPDMSIFFRSRKVSLEQYTIFSGTYEHNPFYQYMAKKRICCRDIDFSGELNMLPSDVQELLIDGCNGVRSLNDISRFEGRIALRKCNISSCKGMEYVFFWSNRLLMLEVLNLENLENLNGLFEAEASHPAGGSFSSLERLAILDCPKIKSLLPATLNLENLAAITVKNCEQLEEIMGESSFVERAAVEISYRVILPKLLRMELYDLSVLRSICSPTAVLVCDSLTELVITSCPNLDMECLFSSRLNPLKTLKSLTLCNVGNLKSVFDDEFWTLVPGTNSFPLERLFVKNCPQLKKVFPPAAAGSLLGYFQSLERIQVQMCDELEEIVSTSPEQDEEDFLNIIRLPKLLSFVLQDLPKLKRVCSRTSRLIGDILWSLSVLNCKELKRVPLHLPQSDNGHLSPPPRLKEIRVSTKEWWESLEWEQPDAKNVLSPICKFLDE